jgi:flavodoxin I
MAKLSIVYWSGTGNTKAMAELIAKGAQEAGAEVSLKSVEEASVADVADYDVVALGCPSMGAEVLEEAEFEPYIVSVEGSVSGKKLALFGSYGWGDGQWMRDWAERMQQAGAWILDEGLIVNDAPEGDEAERCVAYGKTIAQW